MLLALFHMALQKATPEQKAVLVVLETTIRKYIESAIDNHNLMFVILCICWQIIGKTNPTK